MSVVDPVALSVAMLFARALEEFATEAGRSTWGGLSRLVELVRGKLRRDPTGQAALARMQAAPADQASVQALAEAVQAHASNDRAFQQALLGVIAEAKHDPVIGRVVTKVTDSAQVGTVMTVETVLGGLHLYPSMVPASVPASHVEPLRPAQLPPDIAEFIGRGAELAALREQAARAVGWAGGTVVISAIDGKPGIGKSALAVHLAHQLVPDFPDGQLYVNLRGAEAQPLTALQVLEHFLRALGVPAEEIPTDLDGAVARYRTLLASRRVLILLDNAADAGQVRPLLPASPTCVVLVTSRMQLSALEGANAFTLELLSEDDAIELLGNLAGRARVDGDRDTAALIVHRCGLLPLAVRIAGARLRARPGWTLAYLANRLIDERRRLSELEVGDLAVRASFALSYHGLPPAAARLFCLLSLLDVDDLTGEVAAAMAQTDVAAAEQSLERLVDAQLLESPTPGRYRFHDLLRLFAGERAQEQEPLQARDAAIRRALGWFLATVKRAAHLLQPARLQDEDDGHDVGVNGPGSQVFATRQDALSWLEVERPNLVAAVRQAATQTPPTVACELAEALHRFFDLRKHWTDWQAVHEVALHAAERAGDQAHQAKALVGLGLVFHQLRRFDQSVACSQQSLAICRELGDREGESRALNILGRAHREMGRLDQAISYLEESLAISRDLGSQQSEAQSLNTLGSVYWELRRFDDAVACLDQSLTISKESGDRHGQGRTLTRLGGVYRELGRLDQASTCLEQALAISREIGDAHGEAWTLYHLGRTVLHLDRVEDAVASFQQSRAIFRQIGFRYGEGYALRGLGSAFTAAHDEQAAQHAWQDALLLFTELDASEAGQVQRLLTATDEAEGEDRI
jgi:tetratricopeptide (TPR) repeat protein